MLRSLPSDSSTRPMGRTGVAVKFPVDSAPICDFVGALLALRARKCSPREGYFEARRARVIGGRPCQILLRRTSVFDPRARVGSLVNCVHSLLRTLTKGFKRGRGRRTRASIRGERCSVCKRLCGRTLCHTRQVVYQFRQLFRRRALGLRPIALQELLQRILTSADVPFRKRPTAKLRIVNILRAHGLGFGRVLVLSIGRNVLPGTTSSASFVPCRLHRIFKLAAVRRGVTICTFCFCELLRHARHVACVCGISANNARGRRVSHFLHRLLTRASLSVRAGVLRSKRYVPSRPRCGISGARRVVSGLYGGCTYSGPHSRTLSPSTLGACLSYPLGFCFRRVTHVQGPRGPRSNLSNTLFNAVFRRTTRVVFGGLARHGHLMHGRSVRGMLRANSTTLSACMISSFLGGFFSGRDRATFCGKALLITHGIVIDCLGRVLRCCDQARTFALIRVRRRRRQRMAIRIGNGPLGVGIKNGVSHVSTAVLASPVANRRIRALHVVSCGANKGPRGTASVRRLIVPSSEQPKCVFRVFLCT